MPDTPKTDCYQKAIELLARRPHFHQELAAKLWSRGYGDAEVEGVLQRVTEEGYVDDREQALRVASGPMRRKGYGPRRIRAELEGKGVPSDVADSAIAALFPDRESELEAALEAAQRWRPSTDVEPEKVARHLERKGYSTAVILQVLDQLKRRP